MSHHSITQNTLRGHKLTSLILFTCWTLATTTCWTHAVMAQAERPDIKRADVNELTVTERERLGQAITAHRLALEAFEQANHQTACAQMEICITISAEIFGKDYPALAGKYTDYGAICDAAGEARRAAQMHAEALRINKIDLPTDHPLIATNKRSLSRSLLQAGQLKQGLAMSEEALHAALESFGRYSFEYSMFQNDRGYAHALCKNFEQAQQDYREALTIKRRLPEKVSPFSLASTLSNLGEVLCNLGEYPASRQYLDEALGLLNKADKSTMLLKAVVLNNLGYLNRCQHNYAVAVDYYQQSLTISQRYLPENHPDIGRCHLNLSIVYWMERKFEASLDASFKARELFAKTYGTQHPAYGDVLAKIGEDLYTLQRYEAALELLGQTLKIREDAYGANSYYAARTMLMIGACHIKQGHAPKALEMYQRALPILKSALGGIHSQLLLGYDKIAIASLALNDSQAALKHFEESQLLVRQNAAKVLPGLPTDEQRRYRDFLAFNQNRGLGCIVGMPERFKSKELNIGRTTATWVINNKALLNESRGKQIQMQLLGNQSDVQKLKDIRRELSRLVLSAPSEGAEQTHQHRLTELTAQESKYVRQLSQELNLVGDRQWYEVDDVVRAMPKNSVLIELAKVTPLVFDVDERITQPQAARYCAWIISSTGSEEVKFVDLGSADAIDQRIVAVRQQIELDGNAMLQRDPRSASQQRVDVGQLTKNLNHQMRELSKLIVDPIRAHVKAGTNLIVSPDGNLWLAPWAALPVDDRFTYLIEENTLQFVTTSRELLNRATSDTKTLGSAVVIANPDYGPAQPASGNAPPTDNDGTHSLSVGFFPSLPHSEVEAKRIRPSLLKFSGNEPRLLDLAEANEAQVKQINNPSILVFSTHGFFKGSSQPNQNMEDPISIAGLAAIKSRNTLGAEPHLNCGLALANCNRPTQLNGEDGVLTGAEVLGLNLRGTKLVVLSACDTGVGQVQVGEGVAGLRQSFLQAGAQGVIATLWKSLDKESATTVDLFFEQFASGSSAATALRQAHMQRISDLRDIYTEAHPYFWASMTYTGR